MKNRMLIYVLMMISCQGFSQTKGYVSLCLGPSIPTGDFGENSMTNSSAGSAKTGLVLDVRFAYTIKNNLGVIAMLHSIANPVDAQYIADETAKLVLGTPVTVEGGSWSTAGLSGGLYYGIPIEEKTKIEAFGMIGYSNSQSPETIIKAAGASVKQESKSDVNFAYDIGIGIRHDFAKRMVWHLNMDYTGTSADFQDVVITASDGTVDKTSFSIDYNTINIGLGIGLRF
jgi:hypothetical protein